MLNETEQKELAEDLIRYFLLLKHGNVVCIQMKNREIKRDITEAHRRITEKIDKILPDGFIQKDYCSEALLESLGLIG